MKVVKNGQLITLIKEKGDPYFRNGEWGSGESRLLYHLQKKLNKGEIENFPYTKMEWIKKRMWKDGHLVDDNQLYVRTKKPYKTDKDGNKFYLAIWNTRWAIRGAEEDFNKYGEISLQLEEITVAKMPTNSQR